MVFFPKQLVIKFAKYVLRFLELFLGLRFILRLLDANPLTPIVNLLYIITDAIILPFRGIFSDIELRSGGTFDIVVITSMIGYVVIFYLLVGLFHVIFKDKKQEGVENIVI